MEIRWNPPRLGRTTAVIHAFGDYELDTDRFELRRGGARVHVEPQVFDLLAYLVSTNGRLVTRDELLAHVWGHAYVSPATLSSRVKAARRAIGDSGRAQSVIRTVRGRGYQFTGAVAAAAPPRGIEPAREGPLLVGRRSELDSLDRLLDLAIAGDRQLVLVTGEAGAGKTTLVEAFLARAVTRMPVLLARAGCVEHRGPVEPYMPILEALTGLARRSPESPLVGTLARLAPTWLVQLPALVPEEQLDAARARSLGAVPERMLRELVDAFEALSRLTPLVLFLDDLQWSDGATITLLEHLARRDEAAPLLLVAASRPSAGSPVDALRRELRSRGRCVELAVPPLAPADVAAYLRERFPGAEALAGLVFERTDGNPLFVASLLGWWAETGALLESEGAWHARRSEEELARDVPESLRRLLEHEVETRAADDVGLLEAAACAGTRFSAAAAAVGAAIETEEAEARCAELARRSRFLRDAGVEEWPDGTVASRFAFVHDLHRQVLYERISAARRRRIHRELGLRLESAYADAREGHSAELAAHFVQAGEAGRAVQYLRLAAEQAFARGAYEAGIRDLRAAQEHVSALRDFRERDRQALAVESALGGALLALGRWADAEPALRSALGSARALPDTAMVASLLYELAGLSEFRGQYSTTSELLEEALRTEEGGADPARLVERHELMACSVFHQGDFASAVEHAERALALEDSHQRFPLPALYGEHPAISACAWAAFSLWCMGFPAEAVERSQRALELARHPAREYGLCRAHVDAARLHQLRREPELVREHAERAAALAVERGYGYQGAVAAILLGWALAALGRHDEGLARLREGLAAHTAAGAGTDHPYFLALLADASRGDDGLAAIGEALESIDPDHPFFFDAELHRLHAELMLEVRGDRSRAAESLHRAVAAARERDARSLELRASVALARLHADQGRVQEAADLVKRAIGRFPADASTRELAEAQRLAAALRPSARGVVRRSRTH